MRVFLRRAAKALLALLLLIVIAVAAFRLAAATRETAAREQLAPASGHWVQIASGSVFVQEKGDGVPVVLIHGTAAWSELWRATIDALAAAGSHVIALDLPPFGFSDRPGDYTRERQAARIGWLLYFAGSDTSAQSADDASYAKLTLPTALIWGERDSVTPMEQAHDLQRRLPQATLTTLPELGHIPQIKDPDAFNAALLAVLKKLWIRNAPLRSSLCDEHATGVKRVRPHAVLLWRHDCRTS